MTPQERDQLLQEIRALRERVTALETRSPPASIHTRRRLAPEGSQSRALWLCPARRDPDFERVNPEWDARCARAHPDPEGQFGGDGQSIFSVRQSRLGAKATGTLAGKPYEAKFEFDL